MFLHESNLEDFYHADKGTILVSTIHKSKGREFDNVYMIINDINNNEDSNENKRRMYVGMTRAKSKLHIHYNNGLFDKFESDYVEKINDDNLYSMPEEIVIQLTHKDVYLGKFKEKQHTIASLQSGMKLQVTATGMNAETAHGTKEVLRFSHAFCDEIGKRRLSGYEPYKGIIRFIVAWKDQNDDTECNIILPDLYFRYTGKK